MGIYTSSRLLVGLPMEKIKGFLEEKISCEHEGLNEVAEGFGMEYASPYYDSDIDEWYVGFKVFNYASPESTCSEIMALAAKFKKLTNLDALVISSAHVT